MSQSELLVESGVIYSLSENCSVQLVGIIQHPVWCGKPDTDITACTPSHYSLEKQTEHWDTHNALCRIIMMYRSTQAILHILDWGPN